MVSGPGRIERTHSRRRVGLRGRLDWSQVLARPDPALRISAVVVSYRTGPALMDCLHALAADPDIAEIIVVDNGNPPETVRALERLAGQETRLTLTGGGINRGFAAGVNEGVRVSSGDRVLIINPDAVLRRGSLAALEAAREYGAEPMIVGGRIYGPDGVEQRGARRHRLTWGTAAGTFLGLARFRLHPSIRNINRNDEPLPATCVPMGAVSGALMYLSRSGFDRLGGFDEAYFLHVEDLDLCRRAEMEGGSVIFAPQAAALHYGATSEARSRDVERHKARGLSRYFRKFAKPGGEALSAAALTPFFEPLLQIRRAIAELLSSGKADPGDVVAPSD
ncbi:MAG: glycosyltransferase family 2 protein [Alphaproteobacteria bacterium]|nr:glycosyltransferase family 2 protein [Alphaproteobacteria bacterium]